MIRWSIIIKWLILTFVDGRTDWHTLVVVKSLPRLKRNFKDGPFSVHFINLGSWLWTKEAQIFNLVWKEVWSCCSFPWKRKRYLRQHHSFVYQLQLTCLIVCWNPSILDTVIRHINYINRRIVLAGRNWTEIIVLTSVVCCFTMLLLITNSFKYY